MSTALRGRAHPVKQCCDLQHQYWVAVECHSAAILFLKVKSHASEWSLWSGHQPLWMFAGSEFDDRFVAKGAEAHQHSELDCQENCRSQELSQDGAEARCHCYPAHGRAAPQQVHSGVPCVNTTPNPRTRRTPAHVIFLVWLKT